MVWLAVAAAALIVPLAVWWRRGRPERMRRARIAARERGERERLGGAADQVMYGRRHVREED